MSSDVYSWFVPEVTDWTSLWECLHDAKLVSIKHDGLESNASVELKLGFPADTDTGVSDSIAILQLGEATMVLLSHWHSWPIPKICQESGKSSSRGCVLSVTVDQFCKALANDCAYIMQARGAFDSNKIIVEFEGCFDGGDSFNVLLIGKSISVQVDGLPSSIAGLLNLGTEAWTWFESRKQS